MLKIKKKKCVEIFWNYCKTKHEYDNKLNRYVCKVQYLLNLISPFIRSFEREIMKRRRNFESVVLYYHKRKKKCSDLFKKLENNNVHYPDNCIILDAHDLSLNENINLEFITTDDKLITNVNNIISSLNINKFHYLKDFA